MASQPLPAGHDGAGGLRYLSVCSGIEAATVAWHPLGWKAVAFSEIEAFPRAVLKHHYPEVPLHGDFTTIGADDYGAIDLLVGGTPCQSFSIAGLRGGLADDRGNLALEFLRLTDRTRPRWVVWENVPGVLSSLSHDAPDTCPPPIDLDTGNGPEDGEEVVVEDSYDAIESHSFGCFLAGLQELGYGAAYRVFDAQYAGVPQRRRRVFVVGYLGDWRRAAAVLFERHSLSGDTPPRRETGQVAPTVPSRSSAGGGLGTDFDCDGGLIASTGEISHCLNAGGMGRQDYETETLIAHSLRGEGFEASEDGTGRGTPLVPCDPFVLMERGRNGGSNLEYRQDGTANAILTPNGGRNGFGVGTIAFSAKDHGADAMEDCSPTLRAGGHSKSHANAGVMPAVAFNAIAGTLKSCGGKSGTPNGAEEATRLVAHASAVRRLTPRECERLQGFPDDYTLIPWRGKPAGQCPDGPRYKALGNSMAVPCMAWIGQRIAAVEATPAAGNQLSQPPAVSARPDLGHNPSRNDAEGLGSSHVPHGRRDSPAREHDHA